jgi:hypothetical protein
MKSALPCIVIDAPSITLNRMGRPDQPPHLLAENLPFTPADEHRRRQLTRSAIDPEVDLPVCVVIDNAPARGLGLVQLPHPKFLPSTSTVRDRAIRYSK